MECGERLRKYVGADILACEGQGTDGREEEESNGHNQSGRGTRKTRGIDTQDRPHHVQTAGRPACSRRKIANASRHSAAGAKGVSGSGRGLILWMIRGCGVHLVLIRFRTLRSSLDGASPAAGSACWTVINAGTERHGIVRPDRVCTYRPARTLSQSCARDREQQSTPLPASFRRLRSRGHRND